MALPTRDSILQYNYSFSGSPFANVTAKESIDASMYQFSFSGEPYYISYNALNFSFIRISEIEVSNIGVVSSVSINNISKIAEV